MFIDRTTIYRLSVILLLTGGSSPALAAPPQPAWCFQMEGQTVGYLRQEDGSWRFVRPGKELNELDEIERSAAGIILQNRKTKLFIKLTTDQAFWRQPKGEKWNAYYKGGFTKPPAALLKEIASANKPVPAQKPAPRPTPTVSPPVSGPHKYEVRVAYFVPSDRQPVANYEQKIRVITQFVNSMYRNDLASKGIRTEGLTWQQEQGETKIHLIRGKHPAAYYTKPPAYDKNKQFSLVGEEVKPVLGKLDEAIGFVFCENYDETPANIMWNGVLALGAYGSAKGGLAMFSSHLLRDEFCGLTAKEQLSRFFDTTPVKGRKAWDGPMNSPRCEFVENGFGAVIHELGHSLGLPHDFTDQDRNVMSNGYRNIRRNLSSKTPQSKMVTFSDANTLLLSSSRYLNREIDRTDDTKPIVEFEIVDIARATGQVKLQLKAADETALRGYVVMDRNASTLIDFGPLKDKVHGQQLIVRPQAKNGKVRLTMIVVDQGGNQTRVQQEVSVQ